MKNRSYELIIREKDLDAFGHVNNTTYMSIFEQARWEAIHSGGYGFAEVQKFRKGPVVLEAHLNFKTELRLRQKITVQTQLLSYTGKVFELHQEIVNEWGEACCTANFKMGFFDLDERKLILPTTEWALAMGLERKG